ncbi:hypothetical protein VSS37_03925 [Candidatus Thiothrix sp. Deng01]|uniref:Uncharacterized protein n=1 Tax=Candidatus Thiothrix phosphatis TaxID=3112415 RepID=A0ABU6CTK0_9GAMM|nr:hypothetical protein [Candidatus Thiothrix sp. Deng01]MEB4590120.1 hypothetical protein [Candidatus Thiothrix sp. Deng01]
MNQHQLQRIMRRMEALEQENAALRGSAHQRKANPTAQPGTAEPSPASQIFVLLAVVVFGIYAIIPHHWLMWATKAVQRALQ